MQVIAAELVWTGDRFERGVHVTVDNGRITAVGTPARPATLRLPKRALLPGFVNAHSHAFQRGLRGHVEAFPDGAGSFWAWREAMYGLAADLSWKGFREQCANAFTEMRAAGITTVGEFHYFHHAKADDYALDTVVLDAAREAGIRIVLLNAYYATGGIGEPLQGAQLRFKTESTKAYLKQMDALQNSLDPATQSLGFVVHSVRASNKRDLGEIHRESKRRGSVFHIHMENQPLEVQQCMEAYGKRPLQVLLECAEVDDKTTCVHCIHSDPSDMMMYRTSGGRVCLCPLTEANLGDGLIDIANVGAVSLGTDSNARISMLEEMRWLEYGQRLRMRRRGLHEDAGAMLAAATVGGAISLGVDTGEIAPDRLADFAVIDLEAPALRGWTEATLLPAIVTGTGEEVIAGTCVGGDWAWRDGAGP